MILENSRTSSDGSKLAGMWQEINSRDISIASISLNVQCAECKFEWFKTSAEHQRKALKGISENRERSISTWTAKTRSQS